MGDLKEIKEAWSNLYEALTHLIKKRGLMLGIVGSLTGVGSWQISTLWDHMNNVEQLDERYEQMDSMIVVIDQMHKTYTKDSIEYRRYMEPMKHFLDTLPSLIFEAQTTKEAFESVKNSIQQIDSVQNEIKGTQDKIIDNLPRNRRSLEGSF